MYYRIITAPPGYAAHERYLVAAYPTRTFDHSTSIFNANGSRFFDTLEAARSALPANSINVPSQVEHQFIELWSDPDMESVA
jgi:hypothetical protein